MAGLLVLDRRAAWAVCCAAQGLVQAAQLSMVAGEGADLVWDMLEAPPPALPLPGGTILNLAGITGGAVAANTPLALAACDLARQAGARRVLLLSSAAVYGRGDADHHEDGPTAPLSPYGDAKLSMERAACDWAMRTPGAPEVVVLRLGNVAGADALLGRVRSGSAAAISLDPTPDGKGPVRSYIGAESLVRVLGALAAHPVALPPVLNVAAGRPVAMTALLEAAGLPWTWGPPNGAVLPRVALDTDRLRSICPLPETASLAAIMVAEWRRAEGAR